MRVLLHLQDVRILALGVLVERPSWCVNANAHLALHPPMLRRLHTAPRLSPKLTRSSSVPDTQHNFIPLVRSTTVSSAPTAHSSVSSSPPAQTTAIANRSSVIGSFGNWVGRARRLSFQGEGDAGPSHPGTGERERRWSFSGLTRARTHSTDSTTDEATAPLEARDSQPPAPASISPLAQDLRGSSTHVPTLPLMPPLPEDSPAPTPPPPPRLRVQHPYPPLTHPTPAYSHRLYPNFTPYETEWLRTTSYAIDRLNVGLGVTPDDDPVLRVRDFRADHEEATEVGEASSSEAIWGTEGMKATEWDPETEERRRWAGSMM